MGIIDADRRWLVVVAHPDDEVLGCGALLSRLARADAGVAVVHVTDGAPRNCADARRHGFTTPEDYAAARWREARAALDLAGVPAERHHGFGVADQGAACRMAEVARRLTSLVERADAVLTHAYEGGHPDHDAVAFAAHAAARPAGRPVYEMPFYHAGPDGWVRQTFLPVPDDSSFSPGGRRCHREAMTDEGPTPTLSAGSGPSSGAALGPLIRPAFGRPPSPARGEGDAAPLEPEILALTPAELALKRRMAACHATQGDTLASFDLSRELFRRAPAHDFARLPHGGDLLYERHGWNLDRAGWRAAVRAAESDLATDLAGAP